MFPERRTRRSDRPVEAARLYLDAAAERHHYRALTLADAQGLVVVDTESRIDSEALAAVAPLADSLSGETVDGLLGIVTRGEALRVRAFDLGGASMYLAAVGGDATPPAEAEAAMQRILG
jgi:hypothetical protein